MATPRAPINIGISVESSDRTDKGKFASGNKLTNKGGRPKVTMTLPDHEIRKLNAIMAEQSTERADRFLKKIDELWETGHDYALKFIADRLFPIRKGARIDIPGFTKLTPVEAIDFAMLKVEEGKISVEEAAGLMNLVQYKMELVTNAEIKRQFDEFMEKQRTPRIVGGNE